MKKLSIHSTWLARIVGFCVVAATSVSAAELKRRVLMLPFDNIRKNLAALTRPGQG